MSELTCATCRHFGAPVAAPTTRPIPRGPADLSRIATVAEQPPQGQCRRELFVGVVMTPTGPGLFSDYPPVGSVNPACSHYEKRVDSPASKAPAPKREQGKHAIGSTVVCQMPDGSEAKEMRGTVVDFRNGQYELRLFDGKIVQAKEEALTPA